MNIRTESSKKTTDLLFPLQFFFSLRLLKLSVIFLEMFIFYYFLEIVGDIKIFTCPRASHTIYSAN